MNRFRNLEKINPFWLILSSELDNSVSHSKGPHKASKNILNDSRGALLLVDAVKFSVLSSMHFLCQQVMFCEIFCEISRCSGKFLSRQKI